MGKDLLDLRNPAEFKKWKNWFQHYLYSKGLEVHLTGTRPPPESQAEERKTFLRSRAQVMAVMFKCIDSKFNNLIIGKQTPEAVLKTLEITFNASKFQELEVLEKKFESLKFSNDPNKLYPYVRGLVNKYRDLAGKLSDHHLSKKLLNVIPETNYFIPVKLQLMQEAKLNDGEYIIDDVIEKLAETHHSIKYRTNREERRTNFKPNNGIKAAFKTSSKPFGVCKNCGQKGHFAKYCRNEEA